MIKFDKSDKLFFAGSGIFVVYVIAYVILKLVNAN